MERTFAAQLSVRRLRLEITGIFLVCLLLAGVRVAQPEPPNPLREGRVEQAQDEAPDVNRHYDRPADELDYYAPVIRRMHRRWPQIVLRQDTLAEKPPGFPFLMATVARVTGPDFRWLRAFQMTLSAGLAALLYFWLRRSRSSLAAVALIAPLICSSFFIKSSSYLTTDNPTLLCTTMVLTVLLADTRSTGRLLVVLLGATAAASFRQDALWLTPPILVWLVLAAPTHWSQRWLAIGAVLLPLGIVARMVVEWGGLVPSAHLRGVADPGFSFMPAVYLLSVAALFGWPWLLARHGFAGALARCRGGVAAGCGLAGVLLTFATNSAYGRELGHWGGYLWSAAARLPEVAGRSPVFLVLAPLGALALGLVGAELWERRPRAAAILVAAFASWALAVCFNPLVFHRYYEPPLLVFLTLAAGLLPPSAARSNEWRDNLPLLAVGVAQLFITVSTLYFSLFASWRR